MNVQVEKMNEIISFVNEELNTCEKKVQQLREQIRTLSYDLESIQKACHYMVDSSDHTNTVFMTGDCKKGFEDEEIQFLQKQQKEVEVSKHLLEDQLAASVERYDQLKHLRKTCMLKNEDRQDRYSGLTLQEAERQRIAMDIHDTVIQNLTAMILKNEFVMKIMNSDMHRAKIELKNINEVLKNSISELRDIIFNLRPMSLDDLGFEETFYNLMTKISQRTDMDIEYSYNAGVFDADSVVLINILKIIQELCNNSIKHSGGKHIFVRVSQKEKRLVILEQDDGVGFDYKMKKKMPQNSFGLSMIRDRIVLFGGTMQVENLTEGGMRFIIEIPVKRRS